MPNDDIVVDTPNAVGILRNQTAHCTRDIKDSASQPIVGWIPDRCDTEKPIPASAITYRGGYIVARE